MTIMGLGMLSADAFAYVRSIYASSSVISVQPIQGDINSEDYKLEGITG